MSQRGFRERVAVITWAILSLAVSGVAAEPVAVPFDAVGWEKGGEEIEIGEYLGRPALRLRDASAWLPEVELRDGVVEFQIAFPTLARGFAGGIFRVADPANYEHFYLRPHQSGRPDASQYTPVFDTVSGWQLYHGPGYGEAVDIEPATWTPVRILIAGPRADIYVGDVETPLIAVRELQRPTAPGGVGLMSFFTEAWFADFRYDADRTPELRGTPPEGRVDPEGAVTELLLSTVVSEAEVAAADQLPERLRSELTWTSVPTEAGGFVNVARTRRKEGEKSTVFARFQLTSGEPTTARVRFGYSDRVDLFVDGRKVYRGQNDYRSRDERYLGTIGLFDEVFVPLDGQEVREVWLAVSESFGGWGVMVAVEGEGVEVSTPPTGSR